MPEYRRREEVTVDGTEVPDLVEFDWDQPKPIFAARKKQGTQNSYVLDKWDLGQAMIVCAGPNAELDDKQGLIVELTATVEFSTTPDGEGAGDLTAGGTQSWVGKGHVGEVVHNATTVDSSIVDRTYGYPVLLEQNIKSGEPGGTWSHDNETGEHTQGSNTDTLGVNPGADA